MGRWEAGKIWRCDEETMGRSDTGAMRLWEDGMMQRWGHRVTGNGMMGQRDNRRMGIWDNGVLWGPTDGRWGYDMMG